MILIVGIIICSEHKDTHFHVVGLWKVKKQQEKVPILPRWPPRLQTSRNASNSCVGVKARIHRWDISCQVHIQKIGNESTCVMFLLLEKKIISLNQWIKKYFLVILLVIYKCEISWNNLIFISAFFLANAPQIAFKMLHVAAMCKWLLNRIHNIHCVKHWSLSF